MSVDESKTVAPDAPKPASLFETYETDTSAEESGTTVEVLPGIEFTVRSVNSVFARKWVQKRVRKQRQIFNANNGVLPPALSDAYDVDYLSEALILNWGGSVGVRDKDGTPLEFTIPNAKSILARLPQLRRDLLYVCGEQETFRKSSLDALAKN